MKKQKLVNGEKMMQLLFLNPQRDQRVYNKNTNNF